MSSPNSALAAWQLAIMAVVAVGALAAWLIAVYRADQQPRWRNHQAAAAAAPSHGAAEAPEPAGSDDQIAA